MSFNVVRFGIAPIVSRLTAASLNAGLFITAVIASAALAGLAIPTRASAHGTIPFSNTGVVHGCRSVAGVLRQLTSGVCASGETIVHWNITGPAGAISGPGPQGVAGPAGAAGADGADGATGAQGVAGSDGAPGALGPQGPIGLTGPSGPAGADGAMGATGAAGAQGLAGADGLPGAPGATGPQGSTGDKGDPGAPGTNGIDGANGTNGTHPDPPCFDNTNRYVDCGNGTVTDSVTGLIWLKRADCFLPTNWAIANLQAAGLKDGFCSLSDGSSPGDWRLPTKDEWSVTIAHARTYAFDVAGAPYLVGGLGCTTAGPGMGPGSTYFDGGAADATHLPPSLTNDAGWECQAVGPSAFAGVASGPYWSSSATEIRPDTAWLVDLSIGAVGGFEEKNRPFVAVWPVRGGPR